MATNPYTAIPSSAAPIPHRNGATLPPTLAPVIHSARAYFDSRRSENTRRSCESGWRDFARWCSENGCQAMPCSPRTLILYAAALARAGRAIATIDARISAVRARHSDAGQPDPTKARAVRDVLRGIRRQHGGRQRQARGLTRDLVDRMLAMCGDSVRGRRDAALLSVGYDTLLRRSELVSLRACDVQSAEDGSGTVLVRKSKTDQDGQGSVCWLGADTMERVQQWCAVTDMELGVTLCPLFRSLRRGGVVRAHALPDYAVPVIYREMACNAGLPPDIVAGISGHSSRVGAAQDMSAAGLGMAEIMTAGRWKTAAMVGRYTERQAAKRGGAARLAAIQGRG